MCIHRFFQEFYLGFLRDSYHEFTLIHVKSFMDCSRISEWSFFLIYSKRILETPTSWNSYGNGRNSFEFNSHSKNSFSNLPLHFFHFLIKCISLSFLDFLQGFFRCSYKDREGIDRVCFILFFYGYIGQATQSEVLYILQELLRSFKHCFPKFCSKNSFSIF